MSHRSPPGRSDGERSTGRRVLGVLRHPVTSLVARWSVAGICIFSLIVAVRGFGLDRLADSVQSAALLPLLVAIAFNPVSYILRVLSWKVLLAPISQVRLRRLFYIELVAQAGAAVTPEGAGEALRLWLLRRDNVPAATTGTLIAVRKLASSWGLVPFALIALAAGWEVLPRWAVVVLLGYSSVLMVVSATVAIVASRSGLDRRKGFIGSIAQGFKPLSQGPILARTLALTILMRAADAAALYFVGLSMGVVSPFPIIVLALVQVELSGILPNAPGQLGTFEAAVYLTYTELGIGTADALAVAVMFHSQQLLPQIILGMAPLMLALRGRRRHGTPNEGESNVSV